jgi:hypothetical protein
VRAARSAARFSDETAQVERPAWKIATGAPDSIVAAWVALLVSAHSR